MECSPPRRGRPPSFDRETALHRAMEVFWAVGYDAATLSQLKEAMGGLCSPSLYAAFGSKEQLFREALDLYQGSVCRWASVALANEDTREAIAGLLRQAALQYSMPDQPRGCMLDLATFNFAPASAPIRDLLRERRHLGEAALRARLELGITRGHLPQGTGTAAMAGFYRTVLVGLSIQAQDGASRERLLAIADGAMFAWDGWLRAAA
ncbi:TetR/AcrR family transcriptional regulator [Roseomonas aerophila]|uniref:TetR/AcrR family transcriptional regulator n=1 Tax=Teichococcus aerophilus TaxID=1224513 RepID=A0ABR7RMN6_9PROT|nr:TetR/AcrR family transcriptional regulator [Pseudoroseomonas aerophila]MBC9207874.1 TetR/AcrR family transcriptional regulator [Pseudoroseomonas aerophila]